MFCLLLCLSVAASQEATTIIDKKGGCVVNLPECFSFMFQLYLALQIHLMREFNSLEWGLNSPAKPHAFVSSSLQSNLFNNLKTYLTNKCAIFRALLVYKYSTFITLWTDKYIILAELWVNRHAILKHCWRTKWVYIASICIAISYKLFVKWYGIELDLPNYVTIQWYGIVYVIIKLNTKCWTSNYAVNLKDLVWWLLVGTVFAWLMLTYFNWGMLLLAIDFRGLSHFISDSYRSPVTLPMNSAPIGSGAGGISKGGDLNKPQNVYIHHMESDKGGSGNKSLVPSNKGKAPQQGRPDSGALVPSKAPQQAPQQGTPFTGLGSWHQQDPQVSRSLQQGNRSGQGSSTTVPHNTRTQPPVQPLTQGPVSSEDTQLGTYEETQAGFERRAGAADSQDMSIVKTKYHSCFTHDSRAKIISQYPAHLAGQGQGYGYFGGSSVDSRYFINLLDDAKVNEICEFVSNSNIPPHRNETMITFESIFWQKIWDKYLGQYVDNTSGDWPIWHKDRSNNTHDPLISLKTFGEGTVDQTREELKQHCIYVMQTMQEILSDNKPTRGNKEFWKYFHEYMAARHYYQVFLLDNNTR